MNQSEIERILCKKELKIGLEKYLTIMNLLHNTDVSKDADFQKLYNGFYKMRQRKREFYNSYYLLLEQKKKSEVTFQEIFLSLKEKTNRNEASFSSKMVASINPDMPVWDQFVMKNAGIKVPSYSVKNREQRIITAYETLVEWYADYLQTQEAKDIIKVFNLKFPKAEITDIKKIDLFLWQNR